jgi:hypothetical protein
MCRTSAETPQWPASKTHSWRVRSESPPWRGVGTHCTATPVPNSCRVIGSHRPLEEMWPSRASRSYECPAGVTRGSVIMHDVIAHVKPLGTSPSFVSAARCLRNLPKVAQVHFFNALDLVPLSLLAQSYAYLKARNHMLLNLNHSRALAAAPTRRMLNLPLAVNTPTSPPTTTFRTTPQQPRR